MTTARAGWQRVVAAAGLVAALAGGAAAEGGRVVVEDWSRARPGARGIPEGWRGQNWGSPRYDFTVVDDGAGRALHLRSDDDSSTITKEIKVDLRQFPVLEWRWKVVALPAGGDSRRKETDDQAGQIYVTFPRFPQAVRSRVIGYVWDTIAPAGSIMRSQKTGTVTYIVVRSGPADLGKWLTEARNVAQDYRRVYGEDPAEEVGGVSIAIDSNDVKDRAEAFIGAILFRRP